MLRNFRKLFSANVITGILGLLSLTIVSRGLGPESFGIVVVIVSFGSFIEQIAGFQAWQAVTKYAAAEKVSENRHRFWHLVKLGFGLDVVGCLMGAVLGLLGILAFSATIGLDEDTTNIGAAYMLSLAFAVSGTSTAVLRIYEHYDAISRTLVIVALMKLVLVSLGLIIELTIEAVLAIYAGTMILQHLIYVVLMLRISSTEGVTFSYRDIKWQDFLLFPGMIRFILSVYFSTTFRNITHELDTVILSAVSGPSIAGQYKLAKQYGSIVFRAVEPAQQVVYPRIAQLVAAKDFQVLYSLIRRMFLMSLCASVVLGGLYLGIGPAAIRLLVGDQFTEVPMLLGLFLIAAQIFCCFFFLRPLVLSFGRPDAILGIYVIATVLFLIVFLAMSEQFGAAAMMIAQIVFYASWAISMSSVAYLSWRREMNSNQT